MLLIFTVNIISIVTAITMITVIVIVSYIVNISTTLVGLFVGIIVWCQATERSGAADRPKAGFQSGALVGPARARRLQVWGLGFRDLVCFFFFAGVK